MEPQESSDLEMKTSEEDQKRILGLPKQWLNNGDNYCNLKCEILQTGD